MGSSGGGRVTGGFREQTAEERGPARQVGVGDVTGAQERIGQIVSGTQRVGFGAVEGQRQDTARTQELRKVQQEAELSRSQREIDLARGRERALQDFFEGALGRVREGRSQDIQNVIEQRRQLATEGFGAKAVQAQREQGLSQLGRGQELQSRQLASRQAATGVSGGLAAAQQSALQGQQQQQQQGLERQLFLDEVSQKQAALGGLEQSARGAEQEEIQRQQFNLEQRRREILGRITGQFTEAGLGVAERTAAQSAEAARQAAIAGRSAGGGGKK